jgi:hypothetical protein
MKRHVFDPVSLVAGVLFGGLGIAFLTGNLAYGDSDVAWVWPAAIVALGLALLIGAREGQPAPPEVEPDAEGPGLDRPEDEAAP